MVLGFIFTDSIPESPLGIGINVHLNDTGLDGVLDVIDRGTRTSVEDKEHRLVFISSELLTDVFLGVVKDLGLQFNISWGVNSVNISERSGASEGSIGNLGKLFVGVEDLLGLSVKTGRVDISVVNTIFLSSGDSEFEFKKDVELGKLLHVFLADGNVLLKGLLGKVKHVRREKGLSVLLVVFLVGSKKTINPRQPGLLTVISVENDRDSVKLGNLTDMLGSSDAPSDGSGIIGVISGLSGNELTSSLGESDHDGTSVLGGGFHTGVDGVGSYNVNSGDGISLLLSVLQKILKSLSSDNTRLDSGRKLGESLSFTSFAR